MTDFLIIGGTGSLGKKLIDRLLPDCTVAVYSRDEAKHWTIKNELANHSNIDSLHFFVGDVRDPGRIREVILQCRPRTIIIAAALKQVDTCELSPNESVLTNLVGTQNVIQSLNFLPFDREWQVERVLFVSTDKACAPVNVYGMCKAISERIVTSQSSTGIRQIKYVSVRYGNVLESRGSIIPLFKYQADHGKYLTVTNPDMTRFLMTLDDSVDLIQNTLNGAESGETWVPRLPAMRIGDLAEMFSERSGKPVRVIGLRPGEKMHEELINESESVRTHANGKHYVISPAFMAGDGKPFRYTSADDVMPKAQLGTHLGRLGVLDWPLDRFQGLKIEEIVTNRGAQ